MEFVTNLITWAAENHGEVLAVVTALYGVATLIANMTSIESDNKFLAKVADIAKRVGLDLRKD